jgi:hypothetical protein
MLRRPVEESIAVANWNYNLSLATGSCRPNQSRQRRNFVALPDFVG